MKTLIDDPQMHGADVKKLVKPLPAIKSTNIENLNGYTEHYR